MHESRPEGGLRHRGRSTRGDTYRRLPTPESHQDLGDRYRAPEGSNTYRRPPTSEKANFPHAPGSTYLGACTGGSRGNNRRPCHVVRPWLPIECCPGYLLG